MMTKEKKTLEQLEVMLLNEIRSAQDCAGVKSISVQHVTEPGAPANWQSHFINYGTSLADDVNPVLQKVLSRLQRKYDAVP